MVSILVSSLIGSDSSVLKRPSAVNLVLPFHTSIAEARLSIWDTVIAKTKDRNVRGIQLTSQRAGKGQVRRKPKSLQALRTQAMTAAGSAEEKNPQSPPKLTAAPIERNHSMKKS